jgi:hypothetical protein
MAPRLRSDGGRRRRRIRDWAAPFIVTVALAPGCSKRDSNGGVDTKNPPEPVVVQADAAVAKQPPPPPPPEPKPGVVVPPQGWTYLGDIKREQEGCELIFHADCDPGEKCNPPPPAAVPCPVDWLKEDQRGHALKRADDRCEFWPPDGCPKVAQGEPIPPCNPPPPVEFPCPGAATPGKDVLGDIGRAGDKCTFYMVASCPPDVPCNPPPPKSVDCPPGLENNGHGPVSRQADKSCVLTLDKGKTIKIPCP